MSEFTKNQLLDRRDFFRRSAGAAATIGIGAHLIIRAGAADAQTKSKANPWAYDDSRFRSTDPKLSQYQETSRIKVAHRSPRCLAINKAGQLLVGGTHFVTRCTADGAQLSEIQFREDVRCIKEADDGLVYVGLKERIEVYDANGQRRSAWERPSGKPYFTGLAVNDNELFVADAGNRVVLRYDRAGKLKGRIGAKDKQKEIPGFIVPSPFFDVEVGGDGLLRVTNPGRHRVELYTREGDLERCWGKPGAAIENFCGCCNPINLALRADGRVVTVEKGIPRVKIYSAEGVFESVVAGPESFAENAAACGLQDCTVGGMDATTDPQGNVYVLDLVAANVCVFARKEK